MTGKGAGRAARRFAPEDPARCRKRAAARRRWRRCGRVFVAAVLCGAMLVWVDRGFGPVVRQFAQVQAKFLAVTTINQAIGAELLQHPVSYEELVHITRSPAGSILALELDPAEVNDVSSRLTLAANAALGEVLPKRVSIPLGTVLGAQLLAGRGPMVDFYIQPASYVESSFLSTLEGAGFNQTMHNVVLRMTVVVETFAAGYHTSQTVISDMILAQTVIVGDVPNFYAQTAAS